MHERCDSCPSTDDDDKNSVSSIEDLIRRSCRKCTELVTWKNRFRSTGVSCTVCRQLWNNSRKYHDASHGSWSQRQPSPLFAWKEGVDADSGYRIDTLQW